MLYISVSPRSLNHFGNIYQVNNQMYGFGLETVCRTSKQLFENNNNNNNNNNNSNNNSNNKCNPLHVNAQHKSNHSITAKKKKNSELGTCIYFCNIHQ